MDKYQKEFIIKCLEKHPEKYFPIAFDVAIATKNEIPVVINEYLDVACNGLKPIEIVKKFHGVNPDEWEYMIFRDPYWEGMDKQDVDAWARDMIDDNLELCETSDIDEWDDEKFHGYMWINHCKVDSSFMRNYYQNYDVYPYNGTTYDRINQFRTRWGITANSEIVGRDNELDNGNYIYRIEFCNCYFTHPDGVAYVSLCNQGASLTTEEAFLALPKSDPETYKEWCKKNSLVLGTESYSMYKREVKLWELVLTLYPEEKARKELAIVFP